MSDLITTQGHKCEWMYDWGDEFYEGQCGMAFMLTDGTLEENQINYCPKCGGCITLKDN